MHQGPLPDSYSSLACIAVPMHSLEVAYTAGLVTHNEEVRGKCMRGLSLEPATACHALLYALRHQHAGCTAALAGQGHAVRYERIRVSLARFDVLHTGGQCSPIGSPLWVVQWLHNELPHKVSPCCPTARTFSNICPVGTPWPAPAWDLRGAQAAPKLIATSS